MKTNEEILADILKVDIETIYKLPNSKLEITEALKAMDKLTEQFTERYIPKKHRFGLFKNECYE